MHLDPFVSVDGMPFTARRDDVVRVYGQPQIETRNAVDLTELDFGDVVYRFQDCGRLEEVGAQAPILHLGTVSVPFATLAAFVRAQDAACFLRAGFLVSPRFGLAFVPDSPCWVTALAAHAITQWEAMRPELA
ncbi:MAG: hypothetical protein HYX44_04310 [Aquabacterium sp.]|nr:hypothetical protein [Aquabacterium sp.]